jgi:hypothetical protein
MSTALAAPLAMQLRFEIDEPHVIRLSVGKAGMVDHLPMPTLRTGRFDQMPDPQIL